MKSVNDSKAVDKNNLIKVQEDQFIEEFLPQVVCTNSKRGCGQTRQCKRLYYK